MTLAPDDLPPLRDVIRAHGLDARRSLGQNFILDLNVTSRIARAAGPLEGVTVLEIGPGPGGLTRALLANGAKHVIAVEKDARCLPALEQIAAHYPGRLTISRADALAGGGAAPAADGPICIVANLPYNVATPLLIAWLKTEPWPPWFDRMVLMFQREVAERIVAKPRTKDYGRLSIIAQWRTEARILYTLPPTVFTPAPKVESALVELVPKIQPLPSCDVSWLERLTAAAFGQRRKMLRASLRQLGPIGAIALAEIGIDPTRRAEELTVEDFANLAIAAKGAAGG